MEIFKELNKKGYKHYYEGTVEELDSMDKDNQHLHSEIMQVIMWLYEKHGFWISINPMHTDGLWGYEISVFCNDPYKGWFSEIKNYTFSSPTEAYEAAIKYTLKNLL